MYFTPSQIEVDLVTIKLKKKGTGGRLVLHVVTVLYAKDTGDCGTCGPTFSVTHKSKDISMDYNNPPQTAR